jgi:hypothetical protein
MRTGIILFLIMSLNLCSAQTDFKNEIMGSWKLVTKTKSFKATDLPKASSEFSNNEVDPLISSDVSLTFKKDDILLVGMQEFLLEASYSIDKTLLTIGNRKFALLEAKNDILIIEDKTRSKGLRYEYKRIANNE